MEVVDPGHEYKLNHLDGKEKQILVFVKREGKLYPGNVGHHEGTNVQEVLRACIDRLKYVNLQVYDPENIICVDGLRHVLEGLEKRAARRHGRPVPQFWRQIEIMPVCDVCGHIGCTANSHIATQYFKIGESK